MGGTGIIEARIGVETGIGLVHDVWISFREGVVRTAGSKGDSIDASGPRFLVIIKTSIDRVLLQLTGIDVVDVVVATVNIDSAEGFIAKCS